MTEPKKFQKGKHTYVRYGPNFKEVRVQGKEPPKINESASESIEIECPLENQMGVYSNATVIHNSPDDVVLDFAFIGPGQKRGKVGSRIIMSKSNVKSLATLLQKAVEEKD